MFYLAAGYAKITQPYDMLSLLMTWPGSVHPVWIRAIGWVEIGLAVGVVAPLLSSLHLRPLLLVSTGAVTLNAGLMAAYHALQRDPVFSGVNVLLLALAVLLLFNKRTG